MSGCLCIGGGYKPITEKAKNYINALPKYSNFPNKTYSLNQEPGAYQLPIKAYQSQWRYLKALFNQFEDPNGIEQAFWHSLPGVSDILVEDRVFFRWDNWHEGFSGLGSLRISEATANSQKFSLVEHLRFASTVQGAVTAFYLRTDFRHVFHYWHTMAFCDQFVITNRENDSELKYADNFNEEITIPWGFRIEIIRHGHYIVSALADGFMQGLWDMNVEVCDGKIVEEKIRCINPDRSITYEAKEIRQSTRLLEVDGYRCY